MQTRRCAGVLDAEVRQVSREEPRAEGCGQAARRREGEEGTAAGCGPDPAILRLPRVARFAEGGVVTLQHWLDLNA
jgi:hypothetical protein